MIFVCFFKQKTAYEVRISDWSSDVCSSDLVLLVARPAQAEGQVEPIGGMPDHVAEHRVCPGVTGVDELLVPAVPHQAQRDSVGRGHVADEAAQPALRVRSEEHTSELQSLMRNSYDVFCLKKKNTTYNVDNSHK